MKRWMPGSLLWGTLALQIGLITFVVRYGQYQVKYYPKDASPAMYVQGPLFFAYGLSPVFLILSLWMALGREEINKVQGYVGFGLWCLSMLIVAARLTNG